MEKILFKVLSLAKIAKGKFVEWKGVAGQWKTLGAPKQGEML